MKNKFIPILLFFTIIVSSKPYPIKRIIKYAQVVTACNSDYYIMNNYIYQQNGVVQPAPSILPIGFTDILTQSGNYFYVSNTNIPIGADVTLDANPSANGFVQLNPGFETQTGSIFLAEVITGCTENLSVDESVVKNNFKIFPNPAYNILNIESKGIITLIQIYDTNSRLIQSKTINSNKTSINIELLSKGVYFIKTIGGNENNITKLIKN